MDHTVPPFAWIPQRPRVLCPEPRGVHSGQRLVLCLKTSGKRDTSPVIEHVIIAVHPHVRHLSAWQSKAWQTGEQSTHGHVGVLASDTNARTSVASNTNLSTQTVDGGEAGGSFPYSYLEK